MSSDIGNASLHATAVTTSFALSCCLLEDLDCCYQRHVKVASVLLLPEMLSDVDIASILEM